MGCCQTSLSGIDDSALATKFIATPENQNLPSTPTTDVSESASSPPMSSDHSRLLGVLHFDSPSTPSRKKPPSFVEEAAATLLQNSIRGHQARQNWIRTVGAVVLLQQWTRKQSNAARERFLAEDQEPAAIQSQDIARTSQLRTTWSSQVRAESEGSQPLNDSSSMFDSSAITTASTTATATAPDGSPAGSCQESISISIKEVVSPSSKESLLADQEGDEAKSTADDEKEGTNVTEAPTESRDAKVGDSALSQNEFQVTKAHNSSPIQGIPETQPSSLDASQLKNTANEAVSDNIICVDLKVAPEESAAQKLEGDNVANEPAIEAWVDMCTTPTAEESKRRMMNSSSEAEPPETSHLDLAMASGTMLALENSNAIVDEDDTVVDEDDSPSKDTEPAPRLTSGLMTISLDNGVDHDNHDTPVISEIDSDEELVDPSHEDDATTNFVAELSTNSTGANGNQKTAVGEPDDDTTARDTVESAEVVLTETALSLAPPSAAQSSGKSGISPADGLGITTTDSKTSGISVAVGASDTTPLDQTNTKGRSAALPSTPSTIIDASNEIVNDMSEDDMSADKAAEATGDALRKVVESPRTTTKSSSDAVTIKKGQHQLALDSLANSTNDSSNLSGEIAIAAGATKTAAPTVEVTSKDIVLSSVNEAAASLLGVTENNERIDSECPEVEVTDAKADGQRSPATITNDGQETADEKAAVETIRDAGKFDVQEASPTNKCSTEKKVGELSVASTEESATKTEKRPISADDNKSEVKNGAQEDNHQITSKTTGVMSDVKGTDSSGSAPDSNNSDESVRNPSSTIKSEDIFPNTTEAVQFSAKTKGVTKDTTNTPQQTKVAASPKSPLFQSLRSKWEVVALGPQQDTNWAAHKASQLSVTTQGKDSNAVLDYTQQQLKQVHEQFETEKLSHEAEKARLEKRTKELETQMNVLRSSLVGAKKELIQSEQKRLESEEARVDLIEKMSQQEANLAAASAATVQSPPLGSVSQSSTAQMSKAATASQQQTLMEESGKMLEFLRKEVLRLRAENNVLRSDLDVVSGSTQRLLEANAAAESSFAMLNEKAKEQRRKSDTENSDYAIQIQELKMVQENMKDEVRMKQAAYIGEVRSRLQCQESMGKVVDLLQQRCRDSRLVEEVLQITDEAEQHEDDAPLEPSPATPDSSLNESMVGRFTSLFS